MVLGMETNHHSNGDKMSTPYHYTTSLAVNGHTVNVQTASGCFRPYRGIVIDADGRHVAETGGCKSPSRALDRATALARSL